jgi:prepilin-type N-terminal cleavage/methylation domain-containing protein
MVKKAFTMIELIFAIVIIAIIVMGVPQIIAQNAKTLTGDDNGTGAFAQEGIFAAAGVAAKILTYQWDANSLDPNELDAYAKELNTSAPATAFGPIVQGGVNLPLRQGNIAEDKHRRFHSSFTAPSSQYLAGLTPSTFPIIDVAGSGEYKCTWSATVNGGYVTDATYPETGSSSSSNSKMATIQINATGGACSAINNVVTLRVYTANIGEIDYAKRTF